MSCRESCPEIDSRAYSQVHWILIICGSSIFKLAYLLKFTCNLYINTGGAFAVIHGHAQRGKNFESLLSMFPDKVKLGSALPFSFSFCGDDKGRRSVEGSAVQEALA